MSRVFVVFVCLLFGLPLFSYQEEPSTLVGGLISPLTGQPVLSQTDLVVRGAQSIRLSRIYVSPEIPFSFPEKKQDQKEWDKYHLYQSIEKSYKGWQCYPHVRLKVKPSTKEILLTDSSGISFLFRVSGAETELVSPLDGVSNVCREVPSGTNDPRNTRISYEEGSNQIAVHTPEGICRHYLKKGWETLADQLFLLEKEILPNGKVLKYQYDITGELTSIEGLDPKERFVYTSLKIEGSPSKGNCRFTSSTGQTVDYGYETRSIQANLREKTKHWYGSKKEKSKYHFLCPPLLTSITSPLFRSETLEYSDLFLLRARSGKEELFSIESKGFGGSDSHFKVETILLPLGENDRFVPVYQLAYEPAIAGEKGGVTCVTNSDGTSTRIHVSKDLLPTLIQYFGEKGTLKKEKSFSWDQKNWLKAVEERDAERALLYRKTFEYDKYGNPILEAFTGELTGEGKEDTYTIRREFSQEGRNLPLKEEREEGKTVSYSYLPNTNLITSTFTKEGEVLILREFFEYDDSHNLVKSISDDGNSEEKENLSQVTQRRITTYSLRQSGPFLHMPESIVETYWESGIEKPVKKRDLVYDGEGNISQEEIYDSEGNLSYTLHRVYNERGDLLSETNCLGQEARYTYDNRGRLETSLNFSNRLQKNLVHDARGRLREVTERGDDGISHTEKLEYDACDRLVQKEDSFLNRTNYSYDPLVNRVIRTQFPSIQSEEGTQVTVTTEASFDPFGRQMSRTDANGNVTAYRHNTYGLPIEIRHPNGGSESFRYAKSGALINHTDQNGLTIQYKNDSLGRVVEKLYVSEEGKLLAEEKFTYKGLNLVSESDKEGNLTHYSYDGAGRKIREERSGRVTEFSYDPSGWLAVAVKYNENNSLWTRYKRDLAGRVLKEEQSDFNGTILYTIEYSYDEEGNQKTITRYINDEESIESFVYDSNGRLILHQDAAQHKTHLVYDEHCINGLGQKVVQIRTTDPLGVTTVETQDPFGRTVRLEMQSPEGITLVDQRKVYDPEGNLLIQNDRLIQGEGGRGGQTLRYTYTADHLVKSLTRGFGGEEARTTHYTYSASGKLQAKTLPDGVTLSYHYHPLGYLRYLYSSDGKIDHTFAHNRLGHLILAVDEQQNKTIKRKVDPFGNVLTETFPEGLALQKSYDQFNRPLSITMGEAGSVLYQYDPLFLRDLIRVSKEGETLYRHAYYKYDLDGNLVVEKLMGELGFVVHGTEVRGKKTSLSSPYFSQFCTYDARGNRTHSVADGLESLYSYDHTSQLTSEKRGSEALTYTHDSLHNRTLKNGISYHYNGLNELQSGEGIDFSYDLNGNRIESEHSHFLYDPLNRLTEAIVEGQKICFSYDPLGRRLSKTLYSSSDAGWEETDREYYLYDGENEIGAFTATNQPKNLKVSGLVTVGIELNGSPFASILDLQGNIRRLIDPRAKAIVDRADFTAFGKEQIPSHELLNPWGFAAKRLDPELGLIYFGKRYYDPQVGRWLTTDPAGFINGSNLYQYVFNNSFS